MTSSNESKLTLQTIFTSIENDDTEMLELALQRLPLERLSNSEVDTLLNLILSTIASIDRKSSIPLIFKTWEQVYPEIEDMSFYVHLFLIPAIKTPVLRYLSINLPEHSFQTVIDELISYDENDQVIFTLQKVMDVYGEQDRIRYENMRDSAEHRGNMLVYQFFEDLIMETNDYAPIPPWMVYLNGKDDLPKASEIKLPEYIVPDVPELSNEEAVEVLLSGLNNLGIEIEKEDLEEGRKLLLGELQVSTQLQKASLLETEIEKLSLNSLQNDLDYFRVLGPSNPFFNSTPEQMKFGGSRMFLANEFDYTEDDNIEDTPTDWFQGFCEQCHLKIRRRWHAIRRPVDSGGWQGCFHSFECLRTDLAERETEKGLPNLPVEIMIDNIEEQIMSIGIIDRLPG